MAARDHSVRGRLAAGLVATLATGALLAGCGDPEGASSDGVVTTGPEPGAEIVATPAPTTPDATTPGGTTPADGERKTKRDKAKATPTPAPTPVGGEPTIAPAATLKPSAPTDGVDLAFARQMVTHQFASSLMAQEVEKRADHADLRDFAMRVEEDRTDDLTKMQSWGDILGLKPGKGLLPETIAADTRTLGAGVAQINDSRALVKGATFLEGTSDKDFDVAAVDAMITHRKNGIILSTRTVSTGGSALFRKFAAGYAKAERRELRQLRALKRKW